MGGQFTAWEGHSPLRKLTFVRSRRRRRTVIPHVTWQRGILRPTTKRRECLARLVALLSLLASPSPALRSPHFSRWSPRAPYTSPPKQPRRLHKYPFLSSRACAYTVRTAAPPTRSLRCTRSLAFPNLPQDHPHPHPASRRCARTSSDAFPPLISPSHQSCMTTVT